MEERLRGVFAFTTVSCWRNGDYYKQGEFSDHNENGQDTYWAQKMDVIKGCKYNNPMSKMDNIVRRFKLYSDSALRSPQPPLEFAFSNQLLFIIPAIFDEWYKYVFTSSS